MNSITTIRRSHLPRHTQLLVIAPVSTYLLNNSVMAEELPALIQRFYATVAGTISNQPIYVKEPAVPIDESITDDYLIYLEDGKKIQDAQALS